MENINLQRYIAKRIRTLRINQGLSQEKLSEKADLGINYIHNIENKAYNIKIETLEKIISALEVSNETFFDFRFPHNSDKIERLLLEINQLTEEKQARLFDGLELLLQNMK
ncbi:helix-turn-helix domain-containing protein [Streptococcus marmotae]|uniref:helix-turn-helix domain-containing protein n=1 Tax=Streptococcus marmotae TaxID=1825069 RepID=UPI00083389CE|nr:helix-turn-helix transcriptional regulator [Streptococcus marmotae]